MSGGRGLFLAAFTLGVAFGLLLALIALHATFFFGILTAPTEARITYAVEHAVPNLFGEKLQARRASMSLFDKVLVEAHARCPGEKVEN